jgi:glutamate dehydrogenase (NADP+)
VYETLQPVLDQRPEFRAAKILERMAEPERAIIFRVPWVDDRGDIQLNRGFRVQMNSASPRPCSTRPSSDGDQ